MGLAHNQSFVYSTYNESIAQLEMIKLIRICPLGVMNFVAAILKVRELFHSGLKCLKKDQQTDVTILSATERLQLKEHIVYRICAFILIHFLN